MGGLLPPHLQERLEPNAPAPRDGDFVIYWMRIAARATENPALDVALTAAAALGKPVFVYHALSERYRYASDRLHTFILEGAREVQRACAARDLGYAFHLERAGDREPVLRALAKRAALVVTDFMPVQPLLRWDAELAKEAPLWRVDASCVVPVWTLGKSVDRAFDFRALVEPMWKQRLSSPWTEVAPRGAAWLPELPFAPLDLQSGSIAELVASCDIDHGVAPVHHTPGGTTAGLARWRRFRDGKLARYDSDRNDPVLEGTSRISAYLHFGHLSPFLVARETASTLSPALSPAGERGSSSTSCSCGASWRGTSACITRSTRPSTRCPPGRGRRYARTSAMAALPSPLASSSRARRPATCCGTRRSGSSSPTASCTTSCA